MSKSDQLQLTICQRCGRGFVLTKTYRGFLARQGRDVITPVVCPSCFLKAGPLPKESGAVKWFSSRRNYGFIAMEEDQDIFFHRQQLLQAEADPQAGQRARFHMRYSAKGPEALNVEVEE